MGIELGTALLEPTGRNTAPALYLAALAAVQNGQDPVLVVTQADQTISIPSESVDYAVMEHCPGSAFPIQMVPFDADWNDLGTWDAVWQVQPKDAQGNAHVGDVLHTDSRNILVHAVAAWWRWWV